jgi:EmrB/QacA subfamily drug resistance transporter
MSPTMSEKSSLEEVSAPPEQAPVTPQPQPDIPEYPSPRKRVIIMSVLYLSVFLITLDTNIISTAIPKITDEFHSLKDVGWYGSAYILTQCGFQLLMGKIYKFFPAKPVYLTGIFIFEVGSAICGAAPTSTAFIIGRAIAGMGASGLISGTFVIMFSVVPLQQRPIWQGFFGAIFALASVVGPLLGGTFTDHITWRWCFYINLPIGGIVMAVVFFILHLPEQNLGQQAEGWTGKIKQLDPLGNLVFLPGIVCLILALQYGGTTWAWSNARIIVLLVLCAILVAIFIGIQIWKQENGTVPPRIVKKRSIAAALWFGFFQGAGMMVALYYLPIWFQAIKGVSAVKSGIMLLPLVLSTVVGALSSGFAVSKLGYTNPFFIASSVLTTVGAGLLSTLTPESGHPSWIGFQVIFGLGLGFGAQQPMNVAQVVLDKSDIATGTAIIMFTRFMGSAIFLPVAENIVSKHHISMLTLANNHSSSVDWPQSCLTFQELIQKSW